MNLQDALEQAVKNLLALPPAELRTRLDKASEGPLARALMDMSSVLSELVTSYVRLEHREIKLDVVPKKWTLVEAANQPLFAMAA